MYAQPEHASHFLSHASVPVLLATTVWCYVPMIGADAGVGAAGMASREWASSMWLLNRSYCFVRSALNTLSIPLLLDRGRSGSTAATSCSASARFVNYKLREDYDL